MYPLGVQFFGGVDSHVVEPIMETLRHETGEIAEINTFSVGFDVKGFSELDYARVIATRYETEHYDNSRSEAAVDRVREKRAGRVMRSAA